MPFVIHCPNQSCQSPLEVKDEWAGKQVRCPECRESVAVPARERVVAPLASGPPPARPAAQVRVYCPRGHLLVTQEKYIGKQVMCPQCKAILTVTVPAAEKPRPPAARPVTPPPEDDEIVEAVEFVDSPSPPADDSADDELVEADVVDDTSADDYALDDDDDERRPRRRTPRDVERRPRKKKNKKATRLQFTLTNLGLGFHYAKFVTSLVNLVVVFFCAVLLIFVAGGVAAGARGAEIAGFAYFLIVIVYACGVVHSLLPLLGITGSILCSFVPPKTGGRPLMFVSLGLDGVALFLNALAVAVGGWATFRGGGTPAGKTLATLAGLLAFAAFILFLFFVRQLAYHFDQDRVCEEATAIIIHIFILIGACFVGILVIGLFGALVRVQFLVAVLVLAGGLSALVVWIKLALRIIETIGSLRQYMRSRLGV